MLTKQTPDASLDGRKLVYYFASPYSSPHVFVREERYLKALIAAGELHNLGYCLIEPIGMSHHTAKTASLPTGYEHWKERDRAFIDIVHGIIVLHIDGWFESVGVTDEITYAFESGKRVFMYDSNLTGSHGFWELVKEVYLAAQQHAVDAASL